MLYQSLSSGAELWRRYASSSASIRYKLLANVAINGMSALLETKNGFVDANPYAHEAARMLVEEAIVVANACGCTLEHDAEPVRRLRRRQTAKILPSGAFSMYRMEVLS